MEHSYQRWPFLPPTMRTPEQNQQWWEHCFLPVLPVVNFAQAVGSTAVTSLPGNGGTTALAYTARQVGSQALTVWYAAHNWPHAPRARVPAQGHVSQIMALVAAEIVEILQAELERYEPLQNSVIQQEFLCWLVEKYLGRRSLVRLAHRLQQAGQVSLTVPNQFTELYASDVNEADVWGQISETADLVQTLGFDRIILLIDLNQRELFDYLADVLGLFSQLDLLEHPGWLVRAALPHADVTRQQVLPAVSGRLYPIRLEYTSEEIQTLVSRHLQAATDGRVSKLDVMADTAVLSRAQTEIQTLYGGDTLAGWLAWAETLLHLQTKTGRAGADVETAVFTYYHRHIPLRLDENKQGLWRGPQYIALEHQPYLVMKKLFELRGNPAPKALNDLAGSVANLNTIANRLRQKVEPLKGKSNVYLHNRRDQGYWLENALF